LNDAGCNRNFRQIMNAPAQCQRKVIGYARRQIRPRLAGNPHTYRLLWLLMAGLLQMVAAGQEIRSDALTAQDILLRMANAYATCESYSDFGVVKTVFFEKDGNRVTTKPFATAFVRPNHFRYQYEDQKSEGEALVYIIWANGNEVQTWWDVNPGVQKKRNLESAVAGATGVSGCSAHNVPALLLPDRIGGRKLSELSDAKRVEDDKVNGFDCFRIRGKEGDDVTVLWIDKRSYILRMIKSDTKFPDFRTEETTSYHAAFNRRITDKMLEFNPPKRK
jgi:outer membrane lipoprotein-sorting protein